MAYIFQFLIISFSVFSCASQKSVGKSSETISDSVIVNSYKDSVIETTEKKPTSTESLTNKAFFSVTAAGTQMVNEDGQAVTNFSIDRYLVLELKGKSTPKISTITYGNKKYISNQISSLGNRVSIKNFANGKSYYLSASNKNTLWKIIVSPFDGKEDSKIALSKIQVKGNVDNKSFVVAIPVETEIQGEMRY